MAAAGTSTSLKTRKKSEVWLINKIPPKPASGENVIKFYGCKPPTVEQVYLNFLGHHTMLQELTNRQSSLNEAANKTVDQLVIWWNKTAIGVKARSTLQKMITDLHKSWKNLNKQRAKSTKTAAENRAMFLRHLKDTFWAPSPEAEAKLNESTTAESVEDRQFLEALKNPSHTATIDSLDMKT